MESIPGVLDRALERAGAPKALRERVVADAAETKGVTGQVVAVETHAKRQRIYVEESLGLVSFEFPPNDAAFGEELVRAQDAGRMVSVMFKPDAKGANIIDSVLVYAGHASSSARY